MAGMGVGYGLGAAVPDVLQSLLEQRLLQERMALLQRQQAAEEAARQQALAQRTAEHAAEMGFKEKEFAAGAPERTFRARKLGIEAGNLQDQGMREAQADADLQFARQRLNEGSATPADLALLYKSGRTPAQEDEAELRRIRTQGAEQRSVANVYASRDTGGGELTMNARANTMGSIQRRYESATKGYRTVRSAVAMMETGLANLDKLGTNDAAAQPILVKFQKVLDPDSVVRESEYARTMDGQAFVDQMRGAFERFVSGGAGVAKDRLKDYVAITRQYLAKEQQYARQQRQLAMRQAESVGIDPTLVLAEDRDLEGAESTGGESPPPTARKYRITAVR